MTDRYQDLGDTPESAEAIGVRSNHLKSSRTPIGVCDPASRELLIEYELPLRDVVPTVVAYRYTTAKGMVAIPRKEPET